MHIDTRTVRDRLHAKDRRGVEEVLPSSLAHTLLGPRVDTFAESLEYSLG